MSGRSSAARISATKIHQTRPNGSCLSWTCALNPPQVAEIKTDESLRAIPVVVLTTSRADTDIDGIYQLGANSFISKPVRFEELVNLMRLLAQYWLNTVALPAPR